jgi:hypothetical protein
VSGASGYGQSAGDTEYGVVVERVPVLGRNRDGNSMKPGPSTRRSKRETATWNGSRSALLRSATVITSKPPVVQRHGRWCRAAVRRWERLRLAEGRLQSLWFLSVSALCLRT